MEEKDIISDLISKKLLISTDKNHLQLLNKIDISMYGARAWVFTIQQLGLKKDKEYLFKLGLLMGEDAAEEVNEVVKKNKVFLPKEIQLVDKIIEITGFGQVKIENYIPKESITLTVIENPSFNY